jgi:hypothetical protein
MKRILALVLISFAIFQPALGMFRSFTRLGKLPQHSSSTFSSEAKESGPATTMLVAQLPTPKSSFFTRNRFKLKAAKWFTGFAALVGVGGYSYLKGYEKGLDTSKVILNDFGISYETGKLDETKKGLLNQILSRDEKLEQARQNAREKEALRLDQIQQLLHAGSLNQMDSIIVNFIVRGCSQAEAFQVFQKIAVVGGQAGLYRIMEAFQKYGTPQHFDWYAEFVLDRYPETFAQFLMNHEDTTIRRLVTSGQELDRGHRAGWTLPSIIPTLPWLHSCLDGKFGQSIRGYLAKEDHLKKLTECPEGLMILSTLIDATSAAQGSGLALQVGNWFKKESALNSLAVTPESVQLINQLLLSTSDKNLQKMLIDWSEHNLYEIIQLNPTIHTVGQGKDKSSFEYDQSFALLHNVLVFYKKSGQKSLAVALSRDIQELTPKGWFTQTQFKRFEFLTKDIVV